MRCAEESKGGRKMDERIEIKINVKCEKCTEVKVNTKGDVCGVGVVPFIRPRLQRGTLSTRVRI